MRMKEEQLPRFTAAEQSGRALIRDTKTDTQKQKAPPGPSTGSSSVSSSQDPLHEPKTPHAEKDAGPVYQDADALFKESECLDLFDILQQLGVQAVQACKCVGSLRRKSPVTVQESYGQGRMVDAAAHGQRRNLNCHGLSALDLRSLKQDGTPCDFRKPEDRAEAERLQDQRDPDWVIGSPPCTAFTSFS